jgi:hypothetical protein
MFRLLFEPSSGCNSKGVLYTNSNDFKIGDLVYVKIWDIKMKYKNVKYNYKTSQYKHVKIKSQIWIYNLVAPRRNKLNVCELWHFLPQCISNISTLSKRELSDRRAVTPCWDGNFSDSRVSRACCISNPRRRFRPRLWKVISWFIITGLVFVGVWRHTGGGEKQLHSFLSASLDGCELYFGKECRNSWNMKLGERQMRSWCFWGKKNFTADNRATSHYIDWAIPAGFVGVSSIRSGKKNA